MNIPWTAIATIGGLIGVVVAIITVIENGRRSRLALKSDLLLKFYDKFYSSEMHRIRKVAAQKLIAKKSPNYELEDVLDYFGIIGALLERKALDPRLTLGLFDWWILRYWRSAEDYIQKRRKDTDDPDIEMWSYLERMVKRLIDYRKKRNSPEISENAWKKFLQEESSYLGGSQGEAGDTEGS